MAHITGTGTLGSTTILVPVDAILYSIRRRTSLPGPTQSHDAGCGQEGLPEDLPPLFHHQQYAVCWSCGGRRLSGTLH